MLRPRIIDEAVTRFYVDAPPRAAFNYTYAASAVSSDGSAIVFRVATETEAPALWLRPLDALEGRRLTGTDGADFPFWSPDSQNVGFFSAGRLKRMDTRGGTPIVICDAYRAATWSPNGREIAFSSIRTGLWQIYRKDLTSGQPEEQLTTGPEHKIFPEWSHDGRYLLFIQIATTTSEDIWALPLEGDRRPFPVLQTPAIDTNPALSPDGRWLAYESSQSGRPEVYVTRFPASRNAIAAAAPRWQVSTLGGSRPRWSSDGRALFYVSLDDASVLRAGVHASDAGFESEAPRVFGQIPVMPVARAPFDVAADGRVLVLERTINRGVPLAVVTNWRRILASR
jgi:Tol biopolymer transport system component